jgi:hypothetical protein
MKKIQKTLIVIALHTICKTKIKLNVDQFHLVQLLTMIIQKILHVTVDPIIQDIKIQIYVNVLETLDLNVGVLPIHFLNRQNAVPRTTLIVIVDKMVQIQKQNSVFAIKILII